MRRHPGHTRITVVIVRINIGLCLFGLATMRPQPEVRPYRFIRLVA